MNTTENNKLIAEFMGGITSGVPNLINLPQTRGEANIHSVKGSEVLPNGTYSLHRLNELKYHSSWDWLIPVANEIIKSRDEQNANWDLTDLKYSLQTTNIRLVYKSVVEFIKEYNN